MDCYEAVSGARMHATYYRPGGVYRDLPDAMPQYQASQIAQRARRSKRMNENRAGLAARLHRGLHQALPELRRRVRDAAHRQPHLEAAHGRHRRRHARARAGAGFTGPMLRGSGIAWDLRKKQPYEVYDRMDFDIPVGVNGDCYDRYLVRVEEMRQSNRIIKQCVDWLRANPGPVIIDNHKVAPPSRDRDEDQHGRADPPLQALHRRLSTCPTGEAYAAVEHPKGEFGIYLVSRRRQQAVPPEDPRRRASRTSRRSTRCRAAT